MTRDLVRIAGKTSRCVRAADLDSMRALIYELKQTQCTTRSEQTEQLA